MNILESINTELALAIISLLVVLFFITQLVMYFSNKKRISEIPHVAASKEFASHITELESKINELETSNQNLAQAISQLIPQSRTIKKTSLIRYNPFRDAGVGGLQSFSTASIDELGNGVVISNLYSREMTRVTAKEVIDWKQTDQEFSPEEKQAIEKTKG